MLTPIPPKKPTDPIGCKVCPEIGQERDMLYWRNSVGQGTDQLHATGLGNKVAGYTGQER
jgi:hypothetical protein